MSEPVDRPSADPDHTVAADSFRQLVENAPIGMVESDVLGTVHFVNDRWRQITGYRGELPISIESMNRLVHPDDRRRVDSTYVDAAASLTEFDTEARVLRPDGTVRHVRMQGAPVIGEPGELQGFVGTVLDMTELVEATEARQVSERHYRDLMAKAPVGQAISTLRGEVVEVNNAWASLLGYEPDEVVGRLAQDFIHPDDRQEAAELSRQLVRGDMAWFQRERRLLRRDGSAIWVSSSITLERDASGEPQHFHASVFDINDRKAASEALRASEHRYRKLIDEAPVGQLVSELDGSLLEVNRAFVRMMGSTRDELFARDPLQLLHPDDLAPLGQQVTRLLEGDIDSFEMERRLLRADGRVVWVAGGTSLIRGTDHLHLHSIVQDITERKRAERALRESEQRHRDVVDALHDAVLVQSTTELESANRAALTLFGHTFEELQDPDTFEELNPVDSDGNDIPFEQRTPIRALREKRPIVNDVAAITVPGVGQRWLNINAFPRLADGQVVGVVSTFSDITESKLATDALKESEARFRALAEALPLGVFQIDPHGLIRYVNPRWCEITNLSEAEAVGSAVGRLIHVDDRSRVRGLVERSMVKRRPFQVQYRLVTPDGEIRWVNAHGAPTLDLDTAELTGFIGSIEDVTPLIAAQEETARLAGIVESTSDLIGIMNIEDDRLVYLNQAARELFGYVDRTIEDVDHLALYLPEAIDLFDQSGAPAIARGESWTGELPMLAADGSTVQVWQTITAKRRADGTVYQLSSMGRDVTERRRLEAVLAYQATHDSLTRLPNRVLLLDHLELALARAARDDQLVALLFLDLDRFKLVNDTLGHDAGDELLAQVARRIADVLRPADTVARLGGDEFVILAEDIDDEHHALAVAQRVTLAIETEAFGLGDADLMVTASVGIALSPGGAQAHPEALLRDADAAMYRAKDLGRARLELFDESMRRRAARRLELAEQLAAAIEYGHIEVHYQPGIDLTTGRVTSVEALARWQHPERGTLAPYEFIGLAEETGLIVGLGLRVLSDACAQGRLWQDLLGTGAPRVHVNLSARQLTSSNLPTLVEGVLEQSGLRPDLLCLEITESVLMDDAPTAIEMLRDLKDIGLSIAIDDFGTGYSSLSYLRRFPVDVLKVDQSFVDGLGPDPEDSAIVAAIVSLAATLELEAVAEGVETLEQLDLLRRLGCRGAQGYLFARPGPSHEITPLLTRTFSVEPDGA